MQPEERLRAAIATASPRLSAISDADAAKPPAPGKWSPKQVIGHLIDSASNNHQRFVRANFTDDLIFPGYDQERWVSLGQYADAPWESLVTLWREFNLQIARVMEATPACHEVRNVPRAPQSASAGVACGRRGSAGDAWVLYGRLRGSLGASFGPYFRVANSVRFGSQAFRVARNI